MSDEDIPKRDRWYGAIASRLKAAHTGIIVITPQNSDEPRLYFEVGMPSKSVVAGRVHPVIHHSDRGSQYVSIRYSERLAEAAIEPSVGSRGDSYDNALAETINGLYKAELIHRRTAWKTRESVELATLEWVAWFNHHRLMEPLGYIPPAEAEANYYRQPKIAVDETVLT